MENESMVQGQTHIVDLFYPNEQKRREAAERTAAISNLPQDYIGNLELEVIAKLICPENHLNALKIFTQMSIDPEVITYRQDILDDFLRVPQLENVLYENVHQLYVNERVNIQKLGLADSFFALNQRFESLRTYIKCITSCNEFCQKYKDKFKSKALIEMADYFAEIYNSENFATVKKETDLCLEVLSKGVRSVTVGINFDDMMRPVEAMLLSVSNDLLKKKGRFDWLFKAAGPDSKRAISPAHCLYNENGGVNEMEAALFRELKEVNSEYVQHIDTAAKAYYKRNSEDILAFESQMSFYIGAKKLAEAVKSRGLNMCRPQILPIEDRKLEATEIFDVSFYTKMVANDPMANLAGKIICNDCTMDDDGRFFTLTGANNGGKTTYTRAVGIVQVLAQAGIFVPAKSCAISPVDFIYTHFPKEEEVGLNTSRFTQECKQFKTTIDTATKYSMLLLNESIQSTTPSECVYIATELTKIFRVVGVRGVYATHLLDLARGLDKINAEVKGDTKLVSLVTTVDTNNNNERTYHVIRAVPQDMSFARTIYEKYGVSFEDVVKKHRAQ